MTCWVITSNTDPCAAYENRIICRAHPMAQAVQRRAGTHRCLVQSQPTPGYASQSLLTRVVSVPGVTLSITEAQPTALTSPSPAQPHTEAAMRGSGLPWASTVHQLCLLPACDGADGSQTPPAEPTPALQPALCMHGQGNGRGRKTRRE